MNRNANQLACITLTFITCFIAFPKCNAQHLFEFIQDNPEEVLAVLELSSLSATSEADVVDLVFTQEGADGFGVNVGSFTGTFDGSNNPTLDVLPDGELVNMATGIIGVIFSTTGLPISSKVGELDQVSLLFRPITGGGSPSEIVFSFGNFAGDLSSRGRWVKAIPEPSSAVLILSSVFAGMAGSHRWKRTTEEMLFGQAI